MKVALVETKKGRNDFNQYFNHEFEFDQYQLCSDASLKKVLKKDCDINIDLDQYDWVILVGSDALKYFTKETSITTYSGKKVGDKFLATINPAMLAFKPEATKLWETSRDSIISYIKGEVEDATIDDNIARGIDDTKQANEYLRLAIAHPLPYVGMDCETTALYPRNGYVQGVSICYEPTHAAYINANCFDEETEELLQQLISKKTVIFQNAKFDLGFLEYHFNLKFDKFEDVMLLHYLIDETPGTHGLKELALRFTPYGDYEKPLKEWIAEYCKTNGVKTADFYWGDIPFEVMYPYAAMDSLVTVLLFQKFIKIKENTKLKQVYDNILIPGTKFLVDVQNNGVPFSIERLNYSQRLMQSDIDHAIAELYKNPQIKKFEEAQGKEFNPNSVMQLRVLLFDYLGLKPTGKKTGKGADSTDAEVLEELTSQSEIPSLILSIRQKSKIKNTYLDKIIPQLDKDSRLRTGFNLHTTTSGRLSSSGKLNMQQLPRDNPIVKGCIKAAKGHKIVSLDLTTAEVYVAAVLSGDTELMDVFRSGGDFHSSIAKRVFRLDCAESEVKEKYPLLRQAAKAVTFGIMYGAGPHKISEQITKDSGTFFSVQEASEVIDDYFRNFKKLKKWIEESQKFILANGFIYSYFGRKRRLPNVKSDDRGLAGHSIRSGLNFLVQSASSDINLMGAIDMNKYIASQNMKSRIFALVHDSILAEVPDDEIDIFSKKLVEFVQVNRGIMIPGQPIGCDISIGEDYSFGKFEEKYGNVL